MAGFLRHHCRRHPLLLLCYHPNSSESNPFPPQLLHNPPRHSLIVSTIPPSSPRHNFRHPPCLVLPLLSPRSRWARDEPVVIFGFLIDDLLVLAALVGLTVAGLVLTGVWKNVLVLVAVAIGFVI
ncbi:uncharacterized protein LOC120125800 [Hibiscus syriacus]|nr:uncharacterized protein LOC120125800 [Hibiscus syriacus]